MINGKKILSVITARAGSKGIPLKNVRELLGKPLVKWSMEASLASKYIDLTVVSSNCEKVSEVYLKYLLELNKDVRTDDEFWYVSRPEKYATDTSKNEEAVIYSMEQVKFFHALEFSAVINLQPTSPCRLDGLIDKCLEEYYNGDYDSLLTATRTTPFLWRKINGKWEYTVDKNDCCNRKMRQEFEESETEKDSEFVFHDCGSIYITDTKIMIDTEYRIGQKPCIFTVEGINSLQIDTEFDFLLIENMAKAYNLKNLI